MKNGLSSADIKKRLTFLVAGTLFLALAAIGITNWHLYRLALRQEGVILTYLAKSHAQTIESFARHEKEDARLLGQPYTIDDALMSYREIVSSFGSFGDTGSFAVVRREGDSIRWLIRHRNKPQGFPEKIPFDTVGEEEPIKLALKGKSGTIAGEDYRGVPVLAAYEPIPSLDVAVVVKLDLAEIEAPFIQHGIESFLVTLILVLGGGLVYLRVVTPMMPRLMAREETLRSILENASEGIITIDAAANILYANNAVERMFDYPAKALSGKPFSMLMSECAFSIPSMEEAMECTMLRRNGTRFPVIISGRPWAEGTRRAFTLIVQDISERKEADDLLRASEEKYRGLAENAIAGVIQSTLGGKMLYANNALLEMFEYGSLDELIPTAPPMWKNQEDRIKMIEALKSSGRANFEAEMLTKTGKTITVLYSAVIADDTISAMIVDMTERAKAEEALRKSREDFKRILENSPVPMALTDEEQRILLLNGKFIETFGYDLADIPTVEEWWPRAYPDPSYREEVKTLWNRRVEAVMRTGEAFVPMETVVVRKDGNRRNITFDFSFFGNRGLTVFHDITGRKAMEDELVKSREKLANAQELAHVGNWDMDLLTGKGTWSDESFRIFGFEPGAFEPTFDKFISLIHPEDRKKIEDYFPDILSGKLRKAEFDMRITRPDGQERFIHDKLEVITGNDGKPVKIAGANFDITERKLHEQKLEIANHDLTAALEQVRQTQAILMRSEKLASVGTLAAGVAHEILNPLNIIGTICQIMLMDERRGKIHDNLREIMLQVQRTAKITNNLRMFAREKKMDISAVDLHKLFDHTAGLLEHDLNLDNIFIDRRFDPDAPLIMADADQLAQVILTLLNNAHDVLQPRRGGKITAATKAVRDGIEFSLHDDGPGIPEDVLDRIFDPFFTTKEPGKGTGLGLSIALNIIEHHGGTINVKSREGEGTCLTIFLPKDPPRNQAKEVDKPELRKS